MTKTKQSSHSNGRKRRRRSRTADTQRFAIDNPATGETSGEPTNLAGLLETHPDGYGFLRSAARSYRRDASDAYVPAGLIQKFQLQQGQLVEAVAQADNRNGNLRVSAITAINGQSPDVRGAPRTFDELTPVNPRERLQIETRGGALSGRVIDLFAPIGKGQRALLVAPPRTGKTTLLMHIAGGVQQNHPEVTIVVLLVDERPEEVTDMRATIAGELFASSLDQPVENHIRTAQLASDRCRRLVEDGRDVLLIVDSITRLARANNKTLGRGPIASGGLHVRALEFPKAVFSSARALAEGGSLTVVATALVGTANRMDEAIFQEFKGTGNMELVLDPQVADLRIWPAVNLVESRTRRDELLHSPDELRIATLVRNTLSKMSNVEAMHRLTEQLGRFTSNQEFIQLIAK